MGAKPRPRLAESTVLPNAEPTEWLWRGIGQLKTDKIDWMLSGRLAYGSFALVDGMKGVGKSSFCCAVAALVTAGRKIPGSKKRPMAGVLWLTSEESYKDDVKPKLKAAGADLERVHVPEVDNMGNEIRIRFPSKTKALEDAIWRLSVRLVVIDPITASFDPGTDLKDEVVMRGICEGLLAVAQRTGCLILGQRHLKKDKSCARLDQGMGSVAIGNVARTVLSIDHPEDKDTRRVLRVLACNKGKPAGPLEYRIEDNEGYPHCCKWKELNKAMDDPEADQMDKGERSVREDAKRLLRELLATEWVPCKVIMAEAEGAGISSRSLNSVKAELGIQTRRVGRASPPFWEWGPPRNGW